MDVPHKNYDPVLKEAMTLYKNKALDFLGLTGIAPISEPLRTESVEIEIKIEFSDLTFGTQDGRGLHFENEVDLSTDDLLRFGSYNIGLSRIYKREFLSVIFVKNPTKLKEVVTTQLFFKPIVVQCSSFDADAILDKLKKDITAGVAVNELEIVYLPLFQSAKYNPTEIFKESTRLIGKMQVEDEHKRKIYALSILLAGKVVDVSALEAVLEEIKVMGNIIIDVAEKRGEIRGENRVKEETAIKMISKGYDSLEIVELTGLSIERVGELRSDMRRAAMPA